jgi:hypothetical protein
MVKGLAVVAVAVVLAIGGYFIYSAARSVQSDVDTPTGNIDIAKDQAAKSNLVNIKMAIQSYTAVNGQLPPVVSQSELGGIVNPWPTNPWTKQPMAQGESKGDIVYTPGSGTSFTLGVYLSDGSVATAP